MGITGRPPAVTRYSFGRDDVHQGVWAIQRTLNQIGAVALVEDGRFGAETEKVIQAYQRHRGLLPDGVAGPKTQRRLGEGWIVKFEGDLHQGLLTGQIESESGFLIAAVNWSVPGGVDCGFTQRRVPGPPFFESSVQAAFDARKQVGLSAVALRESYDGYRRRSYVAERADGEEYAWRLALLRHNWPAAADKLATGGTLSAQKADWVPDGLCFRDGAPVLTWADWAAWYAMGSHIHQHSGRVARFAFGVPAK